MFVFICKWLKKTVFTHRTSTSGAAFPCPNQTKQQTDPLRQFPSVCINIRKLSRFHAVASYNSIHTYIYIVLRVSYHRDPKASELDHADVIAAVTDRKHLIQLDAQGRQQRRECRTLFV